MKEKKQFPNDHKRIKKKLIAPMNHLFQDKGWEVEFIEVSHERVVVPEVFWITYLNDKIGSLNTSKVMSALIRIANEIKQEGADNITGLASSFHKLNDSSKSVLQGRLNSEGIIEIFNNELSGIKHLFPDFPLNFLIPTPQVYKIGELQYLKEILTKLNDRLSKETTFTFAHLIYPLIEIGVIQINSDSVILNSDELLNYPSSEKSQIVASHLRSSSKLVDRNILTEDKYSWRRSFWKQCFKLEPCKI